MSVNGGGPTPDALLRSHLAWVKLQHKQAEAAADGRILAIGAAMDHGATWDDIGTACGMSRQAANKHFRQKLQEAGFTSAT